MRRGVVLATALMALTLPALAQAQSVERGSPLQRTPFPANQGNVCNGQPQPDSGQFPYQFVNNGAASCSWYQVGVAGAAFLSDTRTGFVGASGTVTSVSVRSGPNPAPLRFFIGRQITPAQNGNPAGNPECCFFVYEVGPFQPAPDTVTTFPVNMPVESSATPTIITNDFIGFSANSNGGTLPLARIPGQDNNGTFGSTGTLSAGGLWPAFGQLTNDTGGGRRSGGYGGIEVLLRYTLTARGGGTIPGPVIRFPTNLSIVALGGTVLRPIGARPGRDHRLPPGQLQRRAQPGHADRVLPAAKKKTRKIRSLGTRKFSDEGQAQGADQAEQARAQAGQAQEHEGELVGNLGAGGTVTKDMTLKKAKKKATRKRARGSSPVARLPPPPLIDFGLGLRRLLLRAADALLPANAVMWQRTMALGRAQVVFVVAELGVADALAGGKATAAELARRLEVDEDALHRVLRAAADDGLLRLDRRGRFALTRLGATLRSDADHSMRPWARYLALSSTRAAWADLGESVRTGEAAFPRVHGTSVWSWFAEHPEEERLFAAAMQAMTQFEAPVLARSELFADRGTHCDVAGGAGTLLAALLDQRPGCAACWSRRRACCPRPSGTWPGAGCWSGPSWWWATCSRASRRAPTCIR